MARSTDWQTHVSCFCARSVVTRLREQWCIKEPIQISFCFFGLKLPQLSQKYMSLVILQNWNFTWRDIQFGGKVRGLGVTGADMLVKIMKRSTYLPMRWALESTSVRASSIMAVCYSSR